eukprot:TRINITY_DN2079_c0_g1_i2.p1 TRINITY_DN2079_c0_g1~~TRINITY_DN2079_c0_g1_i2.p1  ORF type:complete len:925 (-),score=308.71 TRINITY_DN2079_c0_g1_i2:55-2829(-)
MLSTNDVAHKPRLFQFDLSQERKDLSDDAKQRKKNVNSQDMWPRNEGGDSGNGHNHNNNGSFKNYNHKRPNSTPGNKREKGNFKNKNFQPRNKPLNSKDAHLHAEVVPVNEEKTILQFPDSDLPLVDDEADVAPVIEKPHETATDPDQPQERELGAKALKNDLKTVTFKQSNQFLFGEFVLVPRTRGGLTYGKVVGHSAKQYCPLDARFKDVRHKVWRISYPDHNKENLFKDLPTLCIGKLINGGGQTKPIKEESNSVPNPSSSSSTSSASSKPAESNSNDDDSDLEGETIMFMGLLNATPSKPDIPVQPQNPTPSPSTSSSQNSTPIKSFEPSSSDLGLSFLSPSSYFNVNSPATGTVVALSHLDSMSFSSTNGFKVDELVAVPRTKGGFTYGKVETQVECGCPLKGNHGHVAQRVVVSEDGHPRVVKDLFAISIGKLSEEILLKQHSVAAPSQPLPQQQLNQPGIHRIDIREREKERERERGREGRLRDRGRDRGDRGRMMDRERVKDREDGNKGSERRVQNPKMMDPNSFCRDIIIEDNTNNKGSTNSTNDSEDNEERRKGIEENKQLEAEARASVVPTSTVPVPEIENESFEFRPEDDNLGMNFEFKELPNDLDDNSSSDSTGNGLNHHNELDDIDFEDVGQSNDPFYDENITTIQIPTNNNNNSHSSNNNNTNSSTTHGTSTSLPSSSGLLHITTSSLPKATNTSSIHNNHNNNNNSNNNNRRNRGNKGSRRRSNNRGRGSGNGGHVKPLVVIDGPNVAMKHGKQKLLSVKGIQIVSKYYRDLGYDTICFIPQSYVTRKPKMNPTHRLNLEDFLPVLDDVNLLNEMVENEEIVLTPAGDYDDSYCIKYAEDRWGVIVTNDRYNDHVKKKGKGGEEEERRVKRWIRSHCISFTFVRDEFLPNPDFVWPKGRGGIVEGEEG